jgi:hypothetical protein
MFRAACLAVLMSDKLHKKLPGVTAKNHLATLFSVAAIVDRNKTKFYFSQRLLQQLRDVA